MGTTKNLSFPFFDRLRINRLSAKQESSSLEARPRNAGMAKFELLEGV